MTDTEHLETVVNQTEAMRQFIRLTLTKRDMNTQLRSIEAQLAELEPKVLSAMQMDGIQSSKMLVDEGVYQVYISTRTYAHLDPYAEIDRIPYDYLSFSYQSAASYIKELLIADDKEGLRQLAELGITPIEKPKLNVKKG